MIGRDFKMFDAVVENALYMINSSWICSADWNYMQTLFINRVPHTLRGVTKDGLILSPSDPSAFLNGGGI